MDEQWASLRRGTEQVVVELPAADVCVVPGVLWGRIEAFATPAYWAYQVHARQSMHLGGTHRLGRTLREEVGACLLGGHGIPAQVGLAAFEALCSQGAFADRAPSEADLLNWLQRPLNLGNRSVRYRFARQKARYLAQALAKLDRDDFEGLRDRALRDALLALPGIGYKTASWITRNWLDSDTVAILDIHIVRAGLLAGFFDASLSVERHYGRLEAQFLAFSEGLGVRASELDAVMWAEMMASPQSVAQAMQALPASALKAKQGLAGQRARQRGAHTNQLPALS